MLGRLKSYAIGAAGMLVLVVALLLASGWGSAVAAQISSVFVTNDAAHAVPDREQNTDSNGNIKVHEQGTAAVSGTVGIDPAANSVRLDASQQPALHPYTLQLQVTVPNGALSGVSPYFSIPAGKRFVIQYITGQAEAHSQSGEVIYFGLYLHSPDFSVDYLPPDYTMKLGSDYGEYDRQYMVAKQIDMYASGDFNRVALVRDARYGVENVGVIDLTGYLVDLP